MQSFLRLHVTLSLSSLCFFSRILKDFHRCWVEGNGNIGQKASARGNFPSKLSPRRTVPDQGNLSQKDCGGVSESVQSDWARGIVSFKVNVISFWICFSLHVLMLFCYLPIFDGCRSMPAHQPGDPISHNHVVSLLKNMKSSADLSDPFLREIALAAVTHHRKKGNLLLILLLLIAVRMKFHL